MTRSTMTEGSVCPNCHGQVCVPCAEYQRSIGRAEGGAAECASIVGWVRSLGSRAGGDAYKMIDKIADALERGEHTS